MLNGLLNENVLLEHEGMYLYRNLLVHIWQCLLVNSKGIYPAIFHEEEI